MDALATADTVIVPSVPMSVVDGEAPVSPELVAALRLAAESGARMVSLCTGAFALAEAGLLDGRRATAHWMHTDDLAKRYPKVTVDDSVLYVDDGDVLTSAGITAGLDLCLHLVRCDLGARVAGQLARRMVVLVHRAGGQAQFIDLSVPATDDTGLGPVLGWASERLHEPLTVVDLARRAGVSPRTFFRQLQAGDAHHAPEVAAQRAPRPGPDAPGEHHAAHRAGQRAQRPGQRGQPAPALHAARRGVAAGVPQGVRGGAGLVTCAVSPDGYCSWPTPFARHAAGGTR